MKKLFLTIIAMFAMSASMAQVTFTKNINSDSPMTKSSFSETTSLQYITIDENTVALSGYSGGITVLDIPSTVTHDGTVYTVTEISDNAFEECASLTEVRCPATVTRIGKAAFKLCENLESITFAENSQLKVIDDDAFVGSAAELEGVLVCHSNKITTIDIPASVERIGERAFRYCKELEEVNFSEDSQLEVIGARAFSGGSAAGDTASNQIREFNFPASVKTVGNYLFGYANKLETVNIPENSLLDSIPYQMFYMCTRLSSPVYIPSGVAGIGMKAFYHCFQLPKVIFAENSQVKGILQYAFEYCVRMTDIKLPASLEIIEYYGFRDCDALVSLEFEEGSQLKEIGKYAFINCDALDTVTIPATVEDIDYQVFWNCPNLNVVRFLGQTPPVFHGGHDSNLGTDHFFNNTPDTKIMLVPFGRYDAYKDLPTDIRATFARIYEEIPEGETGTISNEYKITANKGLINDGKLVIAAGGEFVNETEDADFGSVEVVSPNAVAGAWNFVGAPFGDYKLDAVKITDTDVAVKLFNFETGAWQNGYATFADEVSAGEGFYAWPFNTVTTPITFKTAKNEGDEHYTLNNDYLTITKPVVENEGNWMALANPYTFKLDVGIFLSDQENVQGNCVYTLENGTFACKELGAAINVTEGFFVNFATAGEKTVEFYKDQRYGAPAKASTEREFVRLAMLDGERSVELLFAQNDDANESYDIYDANKLFSPAEIAEPYFLTDGIALVKEEVNTLPYYATMNVRSYEGKEVKFKADYIPEGLSVSIIDGEEIVDLTEGAEYATEISSGENADRFKVLVKKNVGLADVEELDVRIVNNNRHIAIFTQEDVKVEVYNTLGQRVFETEESNFVLNIVPAGAYVVKVQGFKSVKSQKIIVE